MNTFPAEKLLDSLFSFIRENVRSMRTAKGKSQDYRNGYIDALLDTANNLADCIRLDKAEVRYKGRAGMN